MQRLKTIIAIFLLSFLAVSGTQAESYKDWKKIDVAPGTYQTTDGNGVARAVAAATASSASSSAVTKRRVDEPHSALIGVRAQQLHF